MRERRVSEVVLRGGAEAREGIPGRLPGRDRIEEPEALEHRPVGTGGVLGELLVAELREVAIDDPLDVAVELQP